MLGKAFPTETAMPIDPVLAKSIFLTALDRPQADRPAFLDQACRGDPDLRCRVDQLLQAHAAADSFLERPLGPADSAGAGSAAPPPGECDRQDAADAPTTDSVSRPVGLPASGGT